MGADSEDRDEYKAENVFFVPQQARWSFLLSHAKLPNIGKIVDEAMDVIEKDNEAFHKILTECITVEVQKDGLTRGEIVKLIDFDDMANNAFVISNQFTVIENGVD